MAKKRSDTMSHEAWLKSFTNEKVHILGNYDGRNHRIGVECVLCGHRWFPFAFQVSKGQGCSRCQYKTKSIEYRVPLELFDARLSDRHKGTIVRISKDEEYKGVAGAIGFECKKCGHTWITTGSSVVNYPYTGCSHCSESKYEDIVREYLDEIGIEYDVHKTVGDCRSANGGKSFFDIIINDKLIEVDGEQHFIIPDGGSLRFTREEFKRIVISDILKTRYCMENGIPLLRIRYNQIKKSDQYKKEIQAFLKEPHLYICDKHNSKYYSDELYYRERNITLKEKKIAIKELKKEIENAPERRRNSNIYVDLEGRQYTSLDQLCFDNGVSKKAIRKMYNEGIPIDECLIVYKKKRFDKEQAHQKAKEERMKKEEEKKRAWQDHEGNCFRSKQKMLDYWGVSASTFKRRIQQGYSLEMALTMKTSRQRNKELYGVTLAEACRDAGVNRSGVETRMQRYGMSFEEAVSIPIDERRSHPGKRKK